MAACVSVMFTHSMVQPISLPLLLNDRDQKEVLDRLSKVRPDS